MPAVVKNKSLADCTPEDILRNPAIKISPSSLSTLPLIMFVSYGIEGSIVARENNVLHFEKQIVIQDEWSEPL